MKRIALILLLLAAPVLASAQYWTALDRNIKGVREQIAPDFTLDYGDWIQYGPGAITYGLKAFGLESRSGWGRMFCSQLLGAGFTGAIDGALKYGIGRERPDGSANNSFPSGHTATAFLTACWLHTEYGWKYPWVDAVGYGIGLSTAVQRILRDKHWSTDTMAGAVVGTFSAVAGYWVADKIFGNRNGFWGVSPNWFLPEEDYDPRQKYFEAEFFYALSFPVWKDGVYSNIGGTAGIQGKIPYGMKGRGTIIRGSVTGFDIGRGADLSFESVFGPQASGKVGAETNYADGSGLGYFVSWFVGAGTYREMLLLPRLEAGFYILGGCSATAEEHRFAGITGVSLAYILGYSSKLKLFGEYALHPGPDFNFRSLNVGASAVLYF